MTDSTPLRVAFEFDEPVLRQGLRAHLRSPWMRALLATLYLLFLAGSALIIFYKMSLQAPWGFDLIIVALATLGIGVAAVIMTPAVQYLIGRHLRQHFLNQPITWKIDGQHLHLTHGELGELTLAWAELSKVVRTGEGFLLYQSANVFHWLPATGFASPKDLERFTALAAAKARGYRSQA